MRFCDEEEEDMNEKAQRIISNIGYAFIYIFLTACVVGLFYSISLLINYMSGIQKAEKDIDALRPEETIQTYPLDEDGYIMLPDKPDENFTNIYADLWEDNEDFVGWLFIPDTVIDYPVVQTPTNEQAYIHRSFDGSYSSSGTLFCSANASIENPSMNITIYGHHMRAGTMFGRLPNYQSEGYYQHHRYIYFTTNWWAGVYEVVGAIATDVNEGTYPYYEFTDGTEAEFYEWVENTINRTPYETNRSNIRYGDQFITLSTCNYHTSNGRYIVIARRIM